MIKHCKACGEAHYYPRAMCPFCVSDDTEWQTASGTGTIYTYSVMRRAEIPYAIAYVTLDEGVTMMTNHRRLRLRPAPHRPARQVGVQADRRRPARPDVHPGVIVAGSGALACPARDPWRCA